MTAFFPLDSLIAIDLKPCKFIQCKNFKYMLTTILFGLSMLIVIWLFFLSFFLFKSVNHYKKLISRAKEADLKKLLDDVFRSEDQNKKEIKRILNEIAIIQKEGLRHIQKLGLVRYNPFKDTGGDHSFSLSVLDGNGNGFVLTGLHTRDRTRFYLKSIKDGFASKELSQEEARSVELASKS